MPCFGLSAMYTPYSETGDHRGITVIEEQRQVVLGSTALFTKVGQLHIDMRVGIFSDLYRQNKGKGPRAFGRIRTYNLQYGPVNLEKKKTTWTIQPQAIIDNQWVNRAMYKQTSRSHKKNSAEI